MLDETVTYWKATTISYLEVGHAGVVVEHFTFPQINLLPGDSVHYTVTAEE